MPAGNRGLLIGSGPEFEFEHDMNSSGWLDAQDVSTDFNVLDQASMIWMALLA